MFNIVNHQGNVNQPHNEILPHIYEDSNYQKTKESKYWQGCGKIKIHTLLVGMTKRAATTENSMEVCPKIKNRTTI